MQIFCISELGLVPNKSHPTLKSATPQASKTTDEQQYTNLNMFKWLAKSLTATCAVIVTISKQGDGLYNLSTEELLQESTELTVAKSDAEYRMQSEDGYLWWGGGEER